MVRRVIEGLCACAALGCMGGGGGNGSGACAEFVACGGDPIGEWVVESACLTGGQALAGMRIDEAACADWVQELVPRVAGTLSLRADGTATENYSFAFDADMLVTHACSRALNGGNATEALCGSQEQAYLDDPSIEGAACSLVSTGCRCLVSFPTMTSQNEGPYSVEGATLVDGSGRSPFCVEGDVLEFQSSSQDVTATFVLQRVGG